MDTASKTVEDEARERVARGAAVLDTQAPGWAARIDLGSLGIDDAWTCVAAQAMGTEYTRALDQLGLTGDDYDPFGGRSHGFHAWASVEDFRDRATRVVDWEALEQARDAQWDALDTEWRAAIAARTTVA